MRRHPSFALAGLALLLSGVALGEPLSKPLRAETPVAAGGTIVLENLAGRVEVVGTRGAEAVLTGAAFCDAGSPSGSQALLDALSVHVSGGGDRATLHVVYPVEKEPFRYRDRERSGSSWGHSSSTVDYQGRKVKVTEGGGSGPLLYADLRLEVPAGVSVVVTDHVGRVEARGVGAGFEVKTASADVRADETAGALKVKTGSGDIRVDGSAGLEVSTGSGDVVAARVKGDVDVTTGSGDVKLEGAAGRKVAVHTGSGDVALDDVAGSLELRTGSGDISGRALREVEHLDVGTGSGEISLALDAARLAGGEVEAASGDVSLSLASPPALSLSVSTASGDIDAGNLPGTRVSRRSERHFEADVNGGGVPLRIHTASGSVTVR
ncbi:MAG: DUF4097 family beta strand repeat-containing protein [Thermoanaerobaculia bacterium]